MADNKTEDQKTQSNPEQIRQFFEYITQGWNDLAERWADINAEPLIELRCISSNRGVNVQRFALFQIQDAVQHAEAMNKHGQNVYMCINPIDGRAVIPAGKAATDKDILAAMFCFADADTDGSMANVLSFAGPKFTMSVKTGTTPYVRGHAYWQLEEPCINLDAWRQVQASIAASLGTDPVVINPSRIMRVAGTISYPNKDKQGRGYIQEMVTMRTEFSSDRDPVPFERMMRAFPPTQRSSSATTAGIQIDLGQQAMDRAMAEAEILTGKDWHHNVVRLVASYVSRGLSDTEIHALTDRLTLPGYAVEDTRREVQQAIDGARAKGWTPEPDTIQQKMDVQVPTVAQQFDAPKVDVAQPTWPTPLEDFNPLNLPRRHWIYGRTYIRDYVSLTASAGGIGKTSLTMVEAVAIATGRKLLDQDVHERTKVWVISLEDPRSEGLLRLAAIMQHYNVMHSDLAGWLFLDGEDDIRITLAAETREGVTENDALLEYMINKVKTLGIGVLILDPLISAHQVNENSNMAIQVVVAMLRRLARETGASVHPVHHIRKGNGDEATVDSVRGANALIGAARSARVLNKIGEEAAEKLGLEGDAGKGLFRIDDAKANLAAPSDKATYMQTIGVQIANGEYIAVVVPVTLPDAFEGVTAEAAMKVQRAVGKAAEAEPLRESSQAKAWVGHLIGEMLGIDTTEKAGKGRVALIIKQWIKTDVLRVDKVDDSRTGREVPIVVVGTWINRDEVGL
jgi:hypothetical protein